jgi:DNA-binding CsgD family transcriptional regulator
LLKQEKGRQEKESERKSQEIERKTMELAGKSEAIRSISRRIREIVRSRCEENVAPHAFCEFDQLLLEIERNHISATTKRMFPREFQLVHNDILQKLSVDYPTLTLTERKICLLLREGLSIKEMALMLKVSTRAIEKHRYGIRKKMGLKPRTRLTTVFV